MPYGRIHMFFAYMLLLPEKHWSQGFPKGRVTLRTWRDLWTLTYMCFGSTTPSHIAYRREPGSYAHMHRDLPDPLVLSIIFHICFRSGAISRITIGLIPKAYIYSAPLSVGPANNCEYGHIIFPILPNSRTWVLLCVSLFSKDTEGMDFSKKIW